jgi:two-component system response regulator PilR (NtrC family)
MGPCLTVKPILIIDDEASILRLMTRSLSKHGYLVDTASNGGEGIKKIDANDYSLIITDIKMPVISGDQVFDHLRNKTKKTTPIIAMSGTPWLLNQSGFDAVLQKPSPLKDMLDLIKKFAEN